MWFLSPAFIYVERTYVISHFHSCCGRLRTHLVPKLRITRTTDGKSESCIGFHLLFSATTRVKFSLHFSIDFDTGLGFLGFWKSITQDSTSSTHLMVESNSGKLDNFSHLFFVLPSKMYSIHFRRGFWMNNISIFQQYLYTCRGIQIHHRHA